SLDDDYYEYVEERYALIGARTRRQFRLGDRVRVKVASVDLEERRIDFALLETLSRQPEEGAKGARKAKKAARGAKSSKGIRKTAGKPKNKGKMKQKRRLDGQRKRRGKR